MRETKRDAKAEQACGWEKKLQRADGGSSPCDVELLIMLLGEVRQPIHERDEALLGGRGLLGVRRLVCVGRGGALRKLLPRSRAPPTHPLS